MKRIESLLLLVFLIFSSGCAENVDMLDKIPSGNLGDPSMYSMPTGKYYASGDREIEITLGTSLGNFPDGDDEIWDKIAEKTGVRINVLFTINDINRGKLVVSKSDIVILDIPIIRSYDYIRKDRSFIPLSALVKAYAPNLNALFCSREHFDAKIYVTDHASDNHEFYAIPRLANNVSEAEQFVIRSDLLEKYGPDYPQNAQELYAILHRIIGENGSVATLKNKIYPLSSQGSFQSGGYSLLFTLFDSSKDGFSKDGNLYYSLETPGYKKAIEYLKKLYSEDMLLQDFCFGPQTSFEKLFYNGQVGVALVTDSMLNIANSLFEKEKRPYRYVKIPHLKSESGLECYNLKASFEPALYISSYSKRPIEALRLIDWFYSQEAKDMGVYGFSFNQSADNNSPKPDKDYPTVENSLGFAEFPFLKIDKSEYASIKGTANNNSFYLALYNFITGKRSLSEWDAFVKEYGKTGFFHFQRAYFRYVDMYDFYCKESPQN